MINSLNEVFSLFSNIPLTIELETTNMSLYKNLTLGYTAEFEEEEKILVVRPWMNILPRVLKEQICVLRLAQKNNIPVIFHGILDERKNYYRKFYVDIIEVLNIKTTKYSPIQNLYKENLL